MAGMRNFLAGMAAVALTVSLVPASAFADTTGQTTSLVAGSSDALVAATAESVTSGTVTTDVYAISDTGSYVEFDDIESALTATDAADGIASLATQASSSDGFVIVLDPGHGGYDGGATGIGFQEKTVNLKIAQYCKAKLEQIPGVTVYMTRSDDTYVSLSDRTRFAVDHNADVVISLHNNAGGGTGSEVIAPRNGTWYYEQAYLTATELARVILAALNNVGLGTHSGVYSRDCTTGDAYPDGTLEDYYALINGPRSYGIASIIVEHAFVDNSSDAAFLNNDASLQKLGEADAQAIIDYYNSSSGIDRLYWSVFDYGYYVAHNADANSVAAGRKLAAFGYFKQTGMAAAQRGNVLLDANYYKAKYGDLQSAFGSDMAKYYSHFMEYGLSEGRRGSADFDPYYYKAANGDLQNAFGNDWASYYKHYVQFGLTEDRTAVGDSSALFADSTPEAMYRLYNPNSGEHFYTASATERDGVIRAGWRYEGTSWNAPSKSASPVFRLYNPNAGDHHYTQSASERNYLTSVGWRYEGIAWRSDDSQTAPLYRLYNPNAVAGAHHYTASATERDNLVNLGWRSEGISWYGLSAGLAIASNDEPITGASQTSVAQMVRRYNAVGKAYPSGVYAQYGAANIERFCQILYEEAEVEGVRAEVVFAQAMHETGWLQFGGDVKANQCNFAGIGATGGVPGNSFNMYGTDSVRMGLRAQVQHLKAYGSTTSLNNEKIDPRFDYVTRGSAVTVQALSGKWATGSSYGDALVSQIRALLEA